MQGLGWVGGFQATCLFASRTRMITGTTGVMIMLVPGYTGSLPTKQRKPLSVRMFQVGRWQMLVGKLEPAAADRPPWPWRTPRRVSQATEFPGERDYRVTGSFRFREVLTSKFLLRRISVCGNGVKFCSILKGGKGRRKL